MDGLESALSECVHLRPVGIHVHLRSQSLDADSIGRYWLDVMELALAMRKSLNMELRFVNFGSGIGAVYDEDRDACVSFETLYGYASRVAALNEGTGARLLVETGRFVTCEAGRFYARVADRKETRGRTYLVLEAGLGAFARPALAGMALQAACGSEPSAMEPLYTHGRPCSIRVLNDSSEIETVDVVGNLCTAMDVFAAEVEVRKAQVGDIVEITNAGSYAYTLSPHGFGGFGAPGQYLLRTNGTLE